MVLFIMYNNISANVLQNNMMKKKSYLMVMVVATTSPRAGRKIEKGSVRSLL